jgi:hypothetical protein
MITVFIKQTSSVESQRAFQLIGNVNDEEFERRANDLYKYFYPKKQNIDTFNSEVSQSEYLSLPTDICFRRLELIVLSAMNLPKSDRLGSVDPVCRIASAGLVHQTTVKRRDCNPSWENESFTFDVSNDQLSNENHNKLCIDVAIFDWNRFKTNKAIGKASIPYNDLSEVLNADDGHSKEIELELKNDENSALNEVCARSLIKIRLTNVGMVISGCEIRDLKQYFLLYDENNDKTIDYAEFSAMLKKLSAVASLFTGTENDHCILKQLSTVQVRALLDHKWVVPGKDLKSPLESIMSNLKDQLELKKSQPKAKVEDHGTEIAGDQIKGTTHESTKLDVTDLKTAEGLETKSNNESIENKKLPQSTAVKSSNKTVQDDLKQLEILANKLRRNGMITLPNLVWKENKEGTPDSMENTAIRHLAAPVFEECSQAQQVDLLCTV